MSPDDVRALQASIQAERGPDTPYDICVGGRARGADETQERAHIRSVAAADAAWWLEFIEPTILAQPRQR